MSTASGERRAASVDDAKIANAARVMAAHLEDVMAAFRTLDSSAQIRFGRELGRLDATAYSRWMPGDLDALQSGLRKLGGAK